jgi:hypothetical protein
VRSEWARWYNQPMPGDRDPRPSGSRGPRGPEPEVGILGLVRFTAELGMLGSLGYGGWHLADQVSLSVVLAVALPLLAATVWGRWIAPRAAHRLTDPAKLFVEVILFASAAAVLILAGPNPVTTVLAIGLVLMFLVSLPHRKTERT